MDRQTENFQGNGKLLFGLVLAVLSFWLFAQSILNLTPTILASVSISKSALSIGVSITSLFSGLFIVLAGGLADKIGRVKFTYLGLGLNIIGSLCLVLAANAPLFIIGRICQGLAAACIMPSTLSLVKAYYDGPNRQRAVSYWSMGTWGGTGLASFFGGAVAGSLGWRYVFVFSILASLLSFALIWGTPESKIQTKSRFDFLGLMIFIISMLALNIGLSSAQGKGLLHPQTLGLFALMIIGFIVFYFVEIRKETSFIDFALFHNKYYLGAALSNFLLNSVAGTLIVINTYMQQGRGLSSRFAGTMSLGYLVCVLITIRIGEKLLQRFGARKPMIWGPSCTLIGIAFMALVGVQGPAYLALVFIGYAIFGIGLGIYATPSTDTAISTIEEEKVGTASGIYKMASSLGNSIGVAISLAVFNTVAAGGNFDKAAVFGLLTNIFFGCLSILSIIFIIPKAKK
ncbi:MFS transporter [Streptococcus orisasini]|uniref:MFS transporter n=1 Tax=Streptococcus orisasini TaxID=1080071 RepID=UPI00070A4D38|nr:MFS transporter [Streptococcus orisasini]